MHVLYVALSPPKKTNNENKLDKDYDVNVSNVFKIYKVFFMGIKMLALKCKINTQLILKINVSMLFYSQ